MIGHEKSDSTSRPGSFVDAVSNVPLAVQMKCWVLESTLLGLTMHVFLELQVALSVPAGAPPVWLLTKCQMPVESQD